MKKIVVATTNNNKVNRLKKLLEGLDYELVSLKEVTDKELPEPEEKASTPVEIAIEKAIHYSKFMPEGTVILTQDNTIQSEGIDENDNPRLHIKAPVKEKYGKFTDELAAQYYKALAEKYGGTIPMKFVYGHAVAIKVNDNGRYLTKVIGAESKLEVRLVNRINKLEKSTGYFLAALMEANVDGKWIPYNDLDEESLVKLDIDLYNSITALLRNI